MIYLRRLLEALYGGWERPASDPAILRAIADWLDDVDDVTDGGLSAWANQFWERKINITIPVSRAIQADLRRIATNMEVSE